MNLEDQIGDILGKARLMTRVTTGAAARAAGLSEMEYARMEKEHRVPPGFSFSALAALLELDPVKLAALARGWFPAPPDLTRWHEIRMFTTAEGDTSVNNYLVWDEVNLEAALFDTGLDARPALDCLAANQLQLRHIFITHSHYDHVQALPDLRAAWPKVRVHSGSKNAPVDQRNKPSEIIHLGGLRVTYRETPGHAEDGVTYVIGNWQEDAPHIAVVGDAIFAGSMGRGNQSWELARQKIREQILSLPPETLLCPGHGPFTTVAQEQAHNPFF